MAFTNAGPSSEVTVNTQPPRSTSQFIQTIGVTMTPLAVTTSGEQSFGSAGVSQATAATGILPGDVILSANPPAFVTGVTVAAARVDTAVADKFYLDFIGTGTPASGVWLITVMRFIQSVTVTPGTLSTVPNSITSN